MANVNAPFGFRPVCHIDGAVWNAQLRPYQVDPASATAIFKGDPVAYNSNGYVEKMTAGTGQILGIAWGAEYTPAPPGIIPFNASWPGSGNFSATSPITISVIVDPTVIFEVQAGASNIAKTSENLNVQFNAGTGNTSSGVSGAYVESPAVTATLPFRVVGQFDGPGNGSDQTSAYNIVQVVMNNSTLKNTTGVA